VYICCLTPGMSQSGTFAPFWLAWRSGVELRRDNNTTLNAKMLLVKLLNKEAELARLGRRSFKITRSRQEGVNSLVDVLSVLMLHLKLGGPCASFNKTIEE
jgi:hypothetical protein